MSEPKRSSIKLETPILTSEGPLDTIVLRDPTLDDYMAIGDPWTYSFTPEGRGFPVDHEPTVAMYVQRCLIAPKSYLQISQCSIRDAMALKAWLKRFFVDGVEASGESTMPSPTSSGSTAA